jgi:cyclohexanecarboxylate-CoA ligase
MTNSRQIPDPGPMLWDLIEDHARRRADASACIEFTADGQRRLSWSELSRQADEYGSLLLTLGVRPGDNVAYQLPNQLEFIVITLAILKLGAVCAPLMPIFRERELEFMLARAHAHVLIVPETFKNTNHHQMALRVQAQCPELEHVVVLGSEQQAAPPHDLTPHTPGLDDNAQLLFTSGTSGEPKGVLNTHRTLNTAVAAHIQHFKLADEVVYSPSPIAHQTGFLYGMWLAFTLGAPFVFHQSWDAETGFRALTEAKVTFVQAATPFLADIVKSAEQRGETPASLRYFVATGAAVPRELARQARAVLDAEVGGGWGSTESCMGAAFVPGDPPEKAWSADGKPMQHVHIRIVDDGGRELAPDREGHFELGSPTMFGGYLERPDLTAEAFTADGYFRTGDLAKLDHDGYLHITGRVKDVVNRGGEKVPVAEIEQILYTHPLVQDVAIVAMPDERLGERACAFVIASEPTELLTFKAMQDYLDAQKVSKTYWPERLEIVDDLPRTPSGKVQKYVLRERVARIAADGKAVMR